MSADGMLLRAWAREKNEGAFDEIVRRHGELARAAARSVLPSAGDIDADDIAQAVFLALAQKANAFRPDASVAAWVFTVARRAAIQALKHRRHVQRHMDVVRQTIRSTSCASTANDLDAAMENRMAVNEHLESALADLNAIYLDPILLHYREGIPRIETASRLGITPAALDKRLERGLEKLRRRLTRNGIPLGLAALAASLGSAATASESDGNVLSLTSLHATCASLKVSTLKTEILRMVWLTKIKTLIGVVGIAVAVTLTTGFVVAELLSAGEPVTSVSEAPRPAPVIAAPPTTTPESIQPRSEFLKGVYSLAIPDGWSTQFIEQDWVLIIQEKRDAAVALTILMPDPDEDGNGEIEEVDAAEVANQVEPLLREGLAAWPEAVRPTVTRLEKTAWGNLVVERIRLLGPDPEGDGGGLMEATTIMIASEGGCVFHATTHETDPDNAETRAAMARLRPVIESFRVDKAKLAEVRPLLLEKSMVITRGEPMTVILTTPEPDFVSGDVF